MNQFRIEKLPGDYKPIPISLIRSGGSREVFKDIAALAETIRTHGLLEPIILRRLDKGNGFQVICGERRLKACKEAGLQSVPSIIVDGISEQQVLEMQLVENLQRSDLKLFEEIRMVQVLKDQFHLTGEEIAAKISVSPSSVRDLLLIGKKIPSDITRNIIRIKGGKAHRKELSLSKAVLLARSGLSPEKIRDLVRLISTVGYTATELQRKIAKSHKTKIKRVHAGRVYYNELTKKFKDYIKRFAEYWQEYCSLEEWEDVKAFHLTLKLKLPKDLGETKD